MYMILQITAANLKESKVEYNPDKFYLIEFDTQVGEHGEYNLRMLGLLLGKYGEDDCSSGKVYSVSYSDPLTNTIESPWVSKEDNIELIEVSKSDWEYYNIMLTPEDC